MKPKFRISNDGSYQSASVVRRIGASKDPKRERAQMLAREIMPTLIHMDEKSGKIVPNTKGLEDFIYKLL